MKILEFKLSAILLIFCLTLSLYSCGAFKYERADVKDSPINDADKRKRNIEQGRGFSIPVGKSAGGGNFSFANANELWIATLDILEFTPLSNVDYGGGIIITDWYSENNNPKKSIKISIRFLTNEVRSDALDIKIFNRTCNNSSFDCKFTDSSEVLVAELKKEILKKATIYNKEDKEKIKKKK